MVRQKDGQKFIGESRAPRVQIEYDVEIYGSQKKVELPFCGRRVGGLVW